MKDCVEISQKVIGCCYEVSNTLGAGFLEGVYENALSLEFDHSGIEYLRQPSMEVVYKGSLVGRYQPDFVVENDLVVELKALDGLSSNHESQLLNYLKVANLTVGLLVNFGNPRVQIKRMVK